jgi:acetolactate synthase-1/2/3 large subunit
MAAVTGDLGPAAGVVLLSPADAPAAVIGVRYAAAARASLLVISAGPLDSSGLTPHLKAALQPTSESAASALMSALDLTIEAPRGPVHLALLPHVAAAPATGVGERPAVVAPGVPPAPAALDEAAARLTAAARPLLVVGLGCRSGQAGPWLRALAEALPMPVLVTLRGKGVLPDPHPLVLGLLDEGGTVLARGDLIVTAGLDPLEETAISWPAGLPRLALGGPTDGAGRAGVLSVSGDLALIIEELAPRVRGQARADWDVAELDRLKRARRVTTSAGQLSPSRAVDMVRALTSAGTVATVDEGPGAAVVTARWQAVGPNELLVGAADSGQSFAPAAAVAASLARAGGHAVAFTDAAGLAAAPDAIATAGRHQLPVVLIDLGVGGAETPPTGAAVPDVTARDEEQLTQALNRALTGRGPTVIRVRARPARGSPV